MRKSLTSLLTRCLPGTLIVIAILAVIGIFIPVIMDIALVGLISFTVMILTWLFLLSTFIPEVLTMRHKKVSVIYAHWMVICNPNATYNTCTGEPIVLEKSLKPISGPTSSY